VNETRDVHAGFDAFLRWTLEVERPAARTFLTPELAEPFERYYKALPGPRDRESIRRYLRGFWRSEGGWAARWLARRERPRVLDAGSGFGTSSMLYAAMGAEVVGVDLRPDRLETAERRLAFHAQSTGTRLDVRYERGDLTAAWPRDYDLVWVYNALSHIEPLPDFLRAVCAHLRPGGVLVVGDINGANPTHLKRLEGVRDEVHQEYVAPDGTRHAYAVERPFPPRELRTLMRAHGLRVVTHELYWGGLGVAPELVHVGLLKPLQAQWWFGDWVARRQLMVATPRATE
jgi:2-polyprenyl-3-methyl-5-hydroxy-6-metoxy-1,4-benzoquinol methylase